MVTQRRDGSGAGSGPDAGAASPDGYALDEDAAEDTKVLCFARGVDRAVRYEEPGRKISVAGCRIGGMPFVVGWKAVIGTARN
ncbi:hypothetical protein [Micromonospora sp. NPDC050200]|uniref:hypothetical protein n=1 Tax=Micromonospora sp. NPDC050200 TaxID=3155664 RepID=UPI00340C1E73